MRNFHYIKSNQILRRIGVIMGAAILVAGCASIPPPTAQMAISKTAVSNASSAGGTEYAPLQIKSAKEKLDAAEQAMVAKNYVLAKQLAEEAQVDAELAVAMARSNQAKKAADAVQEDSRALHQEIDRNAQ
ncbi:hypothetical protein FEMY_17410 [Ferrovum myxofaciens]|uniref:DUF4398 domain-containing protein n=2 Tax=Ferrovum myxofaciens TaxID=416213 RepID=A0A149VWX1_9PROT|nr:hypothetical protein FEMY_17410 [Ferrovum myxofaciens]